MMEKKTGLPEGVTPEMVAEAKAKHGEKNVKILELPLGDDQEAGYKGVLACVPNRTVVGQHRRYADTEPKRADEILVKNCILSHRDEVMNDDGLFYGALNGLASLIPVRQAVVKNC